MWCLRFTGVSRKRGTVTVDEYLRDPKALQLHVQHCTGCSECRHLRHVPAYVAREILNPGQTNQTRVPANGPVLSPASREASKVCDHGRLIGVEYCSRCSL